MGPVDALSMHCSPSAAFPRCGGLDESLNPHARATRAYHRLSFGGQTNERTLSRSSFPTAASQKHPPRPPPGTARPSRGGGWGGVPSSERGSLNDRDGAEGGPRFGATDADVDRRRLCRLRVDGGVPHGEVLRALFRGRHAGRSGRLGGGAPTWGAFRAPSAFRCFRAGSVWAVVRGGCRVARSNKCPAARRHGGGAGSGIDRAARGHHPPRLPAAAAGQGGRRVQRERQLRAQVAAPAGLPPD